MKIIGYIFLFLIAVGFVSCSSNTVYDKSKTIDEKGWIATDKIKFDVDIPDTLTAYNFYIKIRNTTDYSLSNLHLFIQTTFPDGSFSKDTAEFLLSDYRGKWLGKGRGKFRDNQFLFKKRFRFPQQGIWSFEFEQATRVEKLTGMDAIGIRIEKIEKSK